MPLVQGIAGHQPAFYKIYEEPDTAKLSPHQYEDFRADQARQLDALDEQIRTALEAAGKLR